MRMRSNRMSPWRTKHSPRPTGWQVVRGVVTGLLALCVVASSAEAQKKAKKRVKQKPVAIERTEIVEADVSSRTIAVTSGFTGQEIVVFGSIHNSRQEHADHAYYDVVVTVEGAPAPLVLRRKSNVAGIWMNTTSVNFDRVPSFYAVSSTRPLEKIALREVYENLGIGFAHVPMTPRHGVAVRELVEYRKAVIRLKKDDKVYVQDDTGVTFIGRSLFRSSVMLPANVPVGLLQARVYLFREGKLLSSYAARLQLEREGVERWLHSLAHEHGFIYGLLAILTAVSAGLLASEVTRRRAM